LKVGNIRNIGKIVAGESVGIGLLRNSGRRKEKRRA
jgi:hypothetical protein